MLHIDGRVRHSSQDLLAFVRCERLIALRRTGGRPPADPEADGDERTMGDLILELGDAHEERVRQRYESEAGRVVEVDVGDRSPSAVTAAAQRTRELLAEGAPVIHQAVLLDEDWMGYADFLIRVEEPSKLGPYGYEVADAKLGRSVKAAAVLQTSLYSILLEGLQERPPAALHVDVGGGQPRVSRPTSRSVAYTRRLMRRYLDAHAGATDEVPDPVPVGWCSSCDHQPDCESWWRERDDLVHVAGMRSSQRGRLQEAGVATIADLAARHPVDGSFRVRGIGSRTLANLAAQSAVQVASREQPAPEGEAPLPVVERLPPDRDDDGELLWRGLVGLPLPSPGDMFYDIEGNPLLEPDGLEYLHGVWLADDTAAGVADFLDAGGQRQGDFVWAWADDSQEERRALEMIVDLFLERVREHPDAHIYHYAPYETAALFRLAQRYATREDELDTLLREGRFVDLFATVRQGLRVGAESYSIKTLERLYLSTGRHGEVAKADDSVVQHQAYRDADGEVAGHIQAEIVEYNREDCRSTAELRAWLEEHRTWHLEEHGLPADLRPGETERAAREVPEDEARELELTRACLERAASSVNDEDREAFETLAGLAGWHRRERKTEWADWFRSIEVADAAEAEASSRLLGGLRRDPAGPTPEMDANVRYRAADQDHRIEERKEVLDVMARGASGADLPPAFGRVVGLAADESAGELLIDLEVDDPDAAPTELVAVGSRPEFVPHGVLVRSLHRTIEGALSEGLDGSSAALDLLLRRVPAELSVVGEEEPEARAIDVALRATGGVLAIQGPPGTGKTRTAGQLIHALVDAGLRVGVTALSHAAITEVVERTLKSASGDGEPIRIGQAAKSKLRAGELRAIEAALSRTTAHLTLNTSSGWIAERRAQFHVIAGTVWLWSREDMADAVDVLVVDEASQLSLANTIAAASAPSRLILVGDPQQLTQPTKARHPGDAESSALDHLLDVVDDGPAVVAPDRGVFLDTSYRMHPSICRVVSNLAYDGELEAADECANLGLVDAGSRSGTGVRFVPVEHTGNASSSREEAAVVRDLVLGLIGSTFVNDKRERRTVEASDIAVITPYNAQVAQLEQVVPDGIETGTVDRFQGKTAAVVIVSLAASSAEDAPRGLDFLLDRHRLNVALSRARAAVFVVGSPALMDAAPSTVRTIEAANDLCTVVEAAGDPATSEGIGGATRDER